MEEDGDDNNINRQPNNKGEKAKGGWILCFFFFWVLFCDGSFFFPLNFCQAHKVFYHQEFGYYLQIKHNRGFLPQSKRFCHSLGFS